LGEPHSALLTDVDFQQQCKHIQQQIQQQIQQAKFAAAIDCSRQLLQQDLSAPEQQQAQYLLVVALRYASQPDSAILAAND
jgi:outer membrane protein assembly factor BamD (BamD/ComL family)